MRIPDFLSLRVTQVRRKRGFVLEVNYQDPVAASVDFCSLLQRDVFGEGPFQDKIWHSGLQPHVLLEVLLDLLIRVLILVFQSDRMAQNSLWTPFQLLLAIFGELQDDL